MPSSIFGGNGNTSSLDPRPSALSDIMQQMRTMTPEGLAQRMMSENPQFRQFVEQNQGKSPEQIAREHGVDLNKFR